MSQPVIPSPVPAPPRKLRRSLQFALFAVSLLWFVLADALAGRAARGLTNRFDSESLRPLLSALFLIFLLTVGFGLLEAVARTGGRTLRQAIGLPRRPTASREWLLGAAIGWGIAMVSVLPMALGRALHVRFWTEPRSFWLLLLNLLTLAAVTLGIEMALRGYPFRRLIAALGPTWATLAMALLVGVGNWFGPDSTWITVLVTLMGSVLLSLAWLRTHGIWLPWGLHFAWNASTAVLFGLPIRGFAGFSSVVQTRAIGHRWLTGDEFGPEGAFFTLIILAAAIIVTIRTTDDYAWDYTRNEIIPAGYEVNPAPPAAHTAMEQEGVLKPASLVQILPTTPQTRSVEGYDN